MCLYFNKGKYSLVKVARWLDSAVAFLPLENSLGKLISSPMKLIYTDHLQLCDLAVRALINMLLNFLLLHFSDSSLFLPCDPAGKNRNVS